jgi:hypothetical protein
MLGVGLLAGLYVAMSPRVIPDLVAFSDSATATQVAALRRLVGLVLGASLITVGYLMRRGMRRSRATP